nr:zinc finger C3H1 domain-containing protein-like isoform X1 [Rhipicephalus microplus]
MTSISLNCELEEGEISDDAEELGDYDARTAAVPRPPAKPFGIEVSSSPSRAAPPSHPHKSRSRVNNNSTARYYKKPLSVFNPPSGHYDRNSGGHSRPPFGGGLRSAVASRPLAPSRGRASLPSFVASHDSGRTSGGDDRCGGRRSSSHLDHYSWFRRSSSGHFSRDVESSTASSSHGRFQPPFSQRPRPERSPPPPISHSGSARKNQSQPKFLQSSVTNDPSYEDLLAQYKSIQHQLEDLNKSSIEEQQPTNATTHEKSSKSSERRKKTHKPKCRRARKSLSEDEPREVLGDEGKEQVPPLSAIPVICDGNVECRLSPVSPGPPTPPAPLPQASDISDDDDETDLMELRRKALETLKNTKPPKAQEEKTEVPPDDSDNASVLPLDELPSDLLEPERPIQEVQEKQQLKKGHRHPWYDRELMQQMRRKDRAYHKWKRHPCYDNWEAFKATKRVYLRMLKRKRAAYAQVNKAQEDSLATSQAAGADSSLPVDNHVMVPMLPLDSIPLPNGQMNVDNYEPVEMEVDSDDGTQTCTLEVAAGSEDEDEDALRAQLLQAVLQKRRRKSKPPESPQQQQQLQQVQPQSSQQSPHQQQQYAVHWNPLLLPNGATTLAMVQPPAEPKEINRTASPNGFPPKAATPPSPFVTPKGRPVPDAPFVETKVSEPVVINLGMDDTTSEEEDGESEAEQEPLPAVENSFSLGLDKLLKEARQQSQVPPPPSVAEVAPLAATPVSVMKLSQAQQLEYRRLKAEIARRELRSVMGAKIDSATQQELNRARRLKQQASAKRSLEALENTLHTERKALRLEGKRMDMLKSEVLTKKSAVRGTHVRIQRLREQLATLERLAAGHDAGIRKANLQLQALQMAIDKRKGHIEKLESQCNQHGKIVYGDKYQLPVTTEGAATSSTKRRISISSLQQAPKRTRITGPDSENRTAAPKRTVAAILAEKIRLQKLELEMRLRLQELKQKSLAKSSSTTAPPAAATMTAQPGTSEAPSKTVVAPAASSPRPESPLSSPSRAAPSRTVVVSKAATKAALATSAKTSGQDRAATVDAEATVAAVPTVTVTITVGNNSEANSNEPAVCRYRTAMEALFLEHCQRQLQTSHPYVGLSSSEFSLPQKDALKKLELCLLRPPKDTAMSSASAQHPVDVAVPYASPLLCFRGYRLNPNYLKQPGCSLDSTSYAHKMHSRTHLCRYELNGECYDERCGGQHKKDYMCTADEVLADLALYSPTLLGILPSDSPQQWKQKAEIYVANMKRKHKGLDTQALCLLIVTEVNRSLNKVAPHYTALQRRGCVFQPSPEPSVALKSLGAADKPAQLTTQKDWKCLLQQQITEADDPELLDLEQDFRYFDSSYLGTAALEQLVIEQPHNVELWLRLAYRHLYGKHNSDEGDPEARLDQALNVFSQALENNRSSPEVWRLYLGWYAAHPTCSDLEYLCHKALDYCSHNSVWWKCVTLVDSLPSKCQLCQQQLYNLTQGVSDGRQPDSQCVLEVVLYWAQLCAVAGNMPLAYLILKTSVKSIVRFEHFVDSSDSGELLDETTRDILQCANMLLSPGDLCFLWLCYLYFVEFRSLPAGLFCIERGSVGRLCSTDSFEIPWDREEGLTQSPDTLLCAFHEAVDELGGPDKCVALFASHLNLLLSQSMGSSAVQLCSVAVGDNPGWSDGWLQLVELYVKAGDMEKATNALQRGLSRLPTDPRLLFKAASGNFDLPSDVIHELLENFVANYFQTSSNMVGLQRKTEESCISFPRLVEECDGHTVYMRLNFIELLKLSGASPRDVCELYETLLTVSDTTSDVQLAWWWYLNYQLEAVVRRDAGSADVVSGLVQRCLESVPTRRHLPGEPRKMWSDYSFTNHMLNLLAAHMTSPRDAADLLWSYLLDRTKQNPALVQRVVELYLQSGDRDRAETVLRAALVPGLQSLRLWQLGIQLAATEGDSYEVHRLFEAAVLSMPYHSDLWCHFLLYELTQGHIEHAQKVVESSSKYQVPGPQEILDSFLAKGVLWCMLAGGVSSLYVSGSTCLHASLVD